VGNVDLKNEVVRVVEFVCTLGHETVPSSGKSRDSVRTIDLEQELVKVLLRQRKLQATERLASSAWEESDCVFTKPRGGPYHPQYLSRLLGTYSAELGLPRMTAHGLRHTSAALMPGQWRAGEGGSGAPRARGRDPSHEPVQPRNSRDAARGSLAHRGGIVWQERSGLTRPFAYGGKASHLRHIGARLRPSATRR
jgi:hypothetical protein